MSIESPSPALFPAAGLLIGERRIVDASGGVHQHVYPGNGQATLEVALGGAGEIDAAVAAARRALPAWKRLSPDRRRDLILRFAELLQANASVLCQLSAAENGMPVSKAAGHHWIAVDNFRYYAGWADKITGEVIPTWPAQGLDYTVREPYGVVGIIISWNAPMALFSGGVAPALAAGNTVVLKPSELAPFTSLKFGELMLEAGLPPGVINIVPGGPEAGSALVSHPGIDKIHFTGGGTTARAILDGARHHLTPVALELGGKSARLVFADCDIEAAVRDAITGATSIAGQGCLLGTRVLVEEAIYEDFIARCKAELEKVALGDPAHVATQMGPVISAAACNRIMGVIEHTEAETSARLVTGGRRAGGALANGYFIEPTLFADVDNRSSLAQNEVFGPVLSVLRFGNDDEALQIANDSLYGLAAYLHTSDVRRAHRIAAQLEVGNVWVNGTGFSPSIPFGGVKQSGFGRTGGLPGLDEFTRIKNVWIAS
ncbi:aldehyde dehydrogenase family protein [Paraburkholderia silvatlantica]|uniref:aldehyde dehydrogenase family protein n=1 Tax=Paraburkholderia silvatlantica TaxID=321895 RepID=UPI00375102EB